MNISSGLGSFWAVTNPERHESHNAFVVYGATKATVSMLTVQYAKALPEIKFNAVEPGFTSTDLTGNGAGQTPAEDAEVMARFAASGKEDPPAPSRKTRASSPGKAASPLRRGKVDNIPCVCDRPIGARRSP